jgi:uncharacterized protein YjbJ (UPF0337 family)
MNIDTLAGEGTNLKGRFKEGLGNATGDSGLQRDGVADQLSGNLRKALGNLRDFARDQPLVAVGIAGLVGFALLRSFGGNQAVSGKSRY